MTQENSQTIGERIRLLRGINSQYEFSKIVNIHKSSLGRYERNESSITAEDLKKLCLSLSTSANWILFGIEPQKIEFKNKTHEKIISKCEHCQENSSIISVYKKIYNECHKTSLQIDEINEKIDELKLKSTST